MLTFVGEPGPRLLFLKVETNRRMAGSKLSPKPMMTDDGALDSSFSSLDAAANYNLGLGADVGGLRVDKAFGSSLEAGLIGVGGGESIYSGRPTYLIIR